MRPILLTIGPYDVLAGPVFAGLAAICTFFYIRRFKDYAGLGTDDLWSLMVYLAAGTFIGGVVGYMLLFGGGPSRNLEYVLRFGTIKGGTFLGNYWGCFLGAFLYSRWHKKDIAPLADLIGVGAMLGLFIMRIGCLQHGCCFGRITDLPLAIIFTIPHYGIRSTLLGLPLHPVQIYSGAASLLIFLYVHIRITRKAMEKKVPAGTAFVASTVLYGIFRFLLEFIRGSDWGVFQPFGLTTTQVLTLLSIAGALRLRQDWRT